MRAIVVLALVSLAVLAPACSAAVQPDVARLHGDGAIDGVDGGGTIALDGGGSIAPDGGGTCAPGLVACASGCTDVSTDAAHCGGCGRACGAGEACVSGACTCPGGACSTPGVGDPSACGPSRVTCSADRVCVDGACACRPPLDALADGRCVDLATDPENCGAPGNRCPDACVGGSCVGGCPDFRRDCDGHCVDTRRDPLSCGDCGRRCAADEVCFFGNCERYQSAGACTTCPCPTCGGDFARCCSYPGLDLAICVDVGECP